MLTATMAAAAVVATLRLGLLQVLNRREGPAVRYQKVPARQRSRMHFRPLCTCCAHLTPPTPLAT